MSSEPVRPRRRPELLAPAGDRECLLAAVENGADAVYFGLNSGWNARARAANFDPGELPAIVAELHRRGVRAHVALNTLVFSDELDGIEPLVREIAAAGTDALLVQDLGLARLVRAICPDLPLHASTQMTLTSAECIEAARDLGIERVVLPRELSVAEIAAIARGTDVPLEAFVHGALCVAYSGQCLTSESLGGRSANRGQCAQACRLPYEVVCDGADVDLGAVRYLLSPQDLAAYALAGDLIDAGVVSFKIEGRLKTPEYVANITRHYRRAIDAAVSGRAAEFSPDDVRDMELSFSRGFSPGWLEGNDHKRLVPGLSSSKRGVLLGTVVRALRDSVEVRLCGRVAAGDGIVFDGDRAAGDEQGGRVFAVRRHGRPAPGPVSDGVWDLSFARGSIDVDRLVPGQRIWTTDDPRLTARLRATFSGPDPQRRLPVDLTVTAAVGQPLRVAATTETGVQAAAATAAPLEAARRHPLTETLLREQLSRLGGTGYELRELVCEIVGEPMAPLSVLGRLRHELVAALDAAGSAAPSRRLADGSALPDLRAGIPSKSQGRADGPSSEPGLELRVLCRTRPQLEAALELGERRLTVDFQDPRDHSEAIRLGRERGAEVWPATPRIQKPGEMGLFRRMAKDEPAGVLVRNLAALAFFVERNIPCVADYSLNSANELTADWLMRRGAQRVAASYDMNRDQLLRLAGCVPTGWLEVVVHQHMPMFHMEHCVFCAVLSPGTNKTNCGRPCDVHEVRLRDRVGVEHPLKADIGCRNTLFNSQAQSGAEAIPELLERGVRHFRIELLDDAPDDVRTIVPLYRGLLEGRLPARRVWTELNALNRVGVTRGTLETRRDPLAIL
ncbi:MAG: U32 family peptidase [Planctomyces sp.]|nr:U32 family peptidase [Planctomyces sp.]